MHPNSTNIRTEEIPMSQHVAGVKAVGRRTTEIVSFVGQPEAGNRPSRMSTASQSDMVSLLLQRDKKAFEQLYDNYSDAIYGLVLKILRDDALAEDALQEAFVRIWQKVHTYDETKGKLFTWMLNVARNIAIDKLRANSSRQADKQVEITPIIESRGPSSTMDVDHIGLRELVDGLPLEQKFVVEKIYYLGYTQSEVAEEFDIPLGTVKSRVRLAMNHLRSKLQ